MSWTPSDGPRGGRDPFDFDLCELPGRATAEYRPLYAALLARHCGQDYESIPIHPVVAERLDIRFFDPEATCRWHEHDWTFRQYILHYIRWSDYIG
nr:hypothetical protein [uncultured Rhodopila sp.]